MREAAGASLDLRETENELSNYSRGDDKASQTVFNMLKTFQNFHESISRPI